MQMVGSISYRENFQDSFTKSTAYGVNHPVAQHIHNSSHADLSMSQSSFPLTIKGRGNLISREGLLLEFKGGNNFMSLFYPGSAQF